VPEDTGVPVAADGTEATAASSEATAVRQIVVWRPDQVPVQHDIPGLGDLRDDTNHGRLLGKSFMRAQLGLSLMCLTLALAVTASYPVIAALAPGITKVTVAGLPLTLIVLGFAFYPVLLAIGWFYNRQARQLEARFTELVDPASRPPDA
jgi:hypothetical protein